MLSISRILIIMHKEFLVLFSNKQSRMLLIVPPIMQMILFAWAATMEVKNVNVGILNNDSGVYSREIIRQLQGSPTFKNIIYLRGQQEISWHLDTQKVLFVMNFANDFSSNILQGKTAKIQLLLDGRRSNAAQITANYVNLIVAKVSYLISAKSNKVAIHSAPNIDISLRYWFNPNLEFTWFFLPNLIGLISFILSLVITGLSVARERELGTLDQLIVSPAKPVEVAIAKILPGGILGLFHGTIFIVLVHFLFKVPLVGSIPLFYTTMLFFTLASSSIGLMISSICATQQQAFLGAFSVGVICILISGVIAPVNNMPLFLQYISNLTPLTHFIELIQGIFLKDISIDYALQRLAYIVIIAIISTTIAIYASSRKSS